MGVLPAALHVAQLPLSPKPQRTQLLCTACTHLMHTEHAKLTCVRHTTHPHHASHARANPARTSTPTPPRVQARAAATADTWHVVMQTGTMFGAGTDADVLVQIWGPNGMLGNSAGGIFLGRLGWVGGDGWGWG